MILSTVQPYLLAIPCGVTAAVLVYDIRRAVKPRIDGERPWRRWRAGATVTALAAAGFLQGGTGSLWLKRLVIAVFVMACVVVLRCSIPLKRLVEKSLQRRRLG